MEQHAQPAEPSELPEEAYRFAEDAQVGFPLRFYNMRPRAMSMYKWILVTIRAGSLLDILVGFVDFFIFLYRLMTLPPEQAPVVFTSISFIIPWMFGLVFGVYATVVQRIYARELPASVLVCSEGLLVIRPKGVEVTRWDEVNSIFRVSSSPGRKSYMLSRMKRKALFFGEALENLENLKAQVEQRIKKGVVKE